MKKYDFTKYNFEQYKNVDEIPDELMNAYLAECDDFLKNGFAWLDEDTNETI
jgi:hypothetical protein